MNKIIQKIIFKPAFSLIEMLMALLVASLLLAALAPVITKKMNENMFITALGNSQTKGWRLYTYSNDCTKSDEVENTCEFTDFKIPKGVYALNLTMVSGGGGGAGATSSIISDVIPLIKSTNGVKTSSAEYDEQIIPITEYMTNIKIETIVGAGGGGGGGAAGNSAPSDTGCKNFGTGRADTVGNTANDFAVFDAKNTLCVTKFNQIHNITSNADYGIAPANTKNGRCWTDYEHPCNNDRNQMDYYYGGCKRIVCNHDGSTSACEYLKYKTGYNWRLPSSDELSKWNTAADWKKFALCDAYENTILPKCFDDAALGVQLEENAYHAPDHLWSSTSVSNNYVDWYIHHSQWNKAVRTGAFALSARCVLDKIPTTFSASGGTSGSMISNIDISNYIKTAGYDGQLVLRAGRGGKGGEGASSAGEKGQNGDDGYRSCIYVQKKPVSGTYGDTVYALCAYGGKGGNAANASSNGAAGGAVAAYTYCREYISGNWKDRSCSVSANGTAAGNTGGSSIAAGGAGANSPFTSNGGGAGGSAGTVVNGINASKTSYGAGGGGATAKYVSSNSIQAGIGGDGAGGYIKITYQNEFEGAGGGGGAGGTMVQISNLPLSADTECTIRVGSGGAYGSGTNGKDGGLTSIQCGKKAQEYIVYGGGGGKSGISGSSLENPFAVGGSAGNIGKINKNIKELGTLAVVTYGEGADNENLNDEQKDKLKFKLNGNKNMGGSGGNSATGAIGGCGGLKNDEQNGCINTNINASLSEYAAPIYTNLLAGDWGKAAAGGGGGGWSREQAQKQGAGSIGRAGYLFLWWDQTGE